MAQAGDSPMWVKSKRRKREREKKKEDRRLVITMASYAPRVALQCVAGNGSKFEKYSTLGLDVTVGEVFLV